jgi:alpha-tubulin suppressor-like RCC1 family protein
VSLPLGSVFTAISAGPNFGMALRSDGTIFAWGDDVWGEMGDGLGSSTPVLTPVPVALPGSSPVTSILAGGGVVPDPSRVRFNTVLSFGLALRSDGSVWAWGGNVYGDLGNGHGALNGGTAPAQVPLPGGSPAIALAAGAGFSLALRADGSVWGWGLNSSGALGAGVSTQYNPVQLASVSGVKGIAAKDSSLLLLLANGEVWGLGDNGNNQLGTPFVSLSSYPIVITH